MVRGGVCESWHNWRVVAPQEFRSERRLVAECNIQCAEFGVVLTRREKVVPITVDFVHRVYENLYVDM